MKVQKFGGSSLRDGASMLQVGRIIASETEDRVVVVSAIQGVTDSLLSFMTQKNKEGDIQSFIKCIKEKHLRALGEIAHNVDVKQHAIVLLNDILTHLERILYGIFYLEEITPRTRDLVQSFGERLSVILVSAMLQDMGVNAVPIDSDDIGIITDGIFGNASVDIDATAKNVGPRINEMLAGHTVPIVTGFFGKSKEGFITIFGRNGTDYSAAVIANAIDADSLEIWKDVDGFMSADPKLVPEAVLIPMLSYEEAAELSYFGAKVLHPRTVEPARAKNISIRMRNVFRPEADGTTINPNGDKASKAIKSISCMANMTLLKVYGAGLGYRSGIITEISARLSDNDVNIYSAATSQTCICLLIEERDIERAKNALEPSKKGIISRIEDQQGCSSVMSSR